MRTGNRDTDVAAYTAAGVPADHIFIKLPEYIDEVQADLDAGKAIGVDDYSTWAAHEVATW